MSLATVFVALGADAAYVWTAVAVTLAALALESAALAIRRRDLARHVDTTDATGEGR